MQNFSLETSRLVLRPVSEADWECILAVLNDADFIRYVGDRGIQTPEAARKYIRDRFIPSFAQYGYGAMIVALKTTNQAIGTCGLFKRSYLPEPDIGYALLPQWRNQGYSIEAARAVLNYAIQQPNIGQPCAIVSAENSGSIQLLQSLGMTRQGTVTTEDNEILLLFK